MYGAALAAGVMAVAACSSASGSSPASGTAAASAAAAAGSGSPASATGGAAGQQAGGASASVVAADQAAVKAVSTFPTAIPVTTALPSAPPKGKTVIYMQCEQQECGYEGKGVVAAAKAAGWTAKILNFQAANPATLVAALKEALQYHPVAVFFAGVPQEAWQSVQPLYVAAGSYLVDSFNGAVPAGPGTLPGHAYPADYSDMGTLLADEQIADSGGAPVKSLLVNVPDYDVFAPTVAAYKAQIAKQCPGCQVNEVDSTLPQLLGGQLTPAVVSAAKRTSGLQYIVSVNGSFTEQLPQALQSAGLVGKYKLISGAGVAEDQQNVLQGTQLETDGSPLELGGWQDVDEAIRMVMHLPVPAGDRKLPWVLLTKSNIGTPEDSYDKPADYAAQFEALWHVG
jgi:ribose transport system substrate-binding protein